MATNLPTRQPGAEPETWAIVAMCPDLVQARSVQDELGAHKIPARRQIYELQCGGPLVKIYVPADREEEGLRITAVTATVPSPSVEGSARAQGFMGMILGMDNVLTALGMWLARRFDPQFKKEESDFLARRSSACSDARREAVAE